ncbi:MAG: chemoreceptor glutamine deamidase CheD [Burkholderiales bacterium]|nr:chemoreceptor glutamine deamidase CheD [Burkholderiales bacterium]
MAGIGTAPSLYYDRQHGVHAAKILPGEYFITGEDIVLVTVLGSCVAACIRDPGLGIGGMNHFMLPEAGADSDNLLSAPARYGTYAMEVLINELVKQGARRHALEAKVFGGGNVMRNLTLSNVGTRNAQFVLKFLELERIAVKARDLEKDYARKVYFFPRSGRVRLKMIRGMHNDTILAREREYGQRIRAERVGGEVELF